MEEFQDFLHFGLDKRITEAITELGYSKPTPIQSAAIPLVLEGRDVMGAAQTGTGKTAGFGLPLLQKILSFENTSVSPARHPVRALILSPTRELADQTAEALTQFASKTLLKVAAVYGGVDIRPQAEALRKGVEILIATPGRLLDHLEQRNTTLSQVQMVILDEADRMLDMGFLPDISRILSRLPVSKQNLMFSATFSPEIKRLANNFLNNPVIVEVAKRNAAATTISQELFEVDETNKKDALAELLRARGEDQDGNPLQTLVFVNAKITARRLARLLQREGFNSDSIHGDRTQEERSRTLQSFKENKVNVLVATDVAARGLDIAELPLVINYDVPLSAEDYVHRIGRTGRAGVKGLALTLMTSSDARNVSAIEKLIGKTFLRQKIDPVPIRRRYSNPRFSKSPYSYKPPVTEESVDPFFDSPYVPSRSEKRIVESEVGPSKDKYVPRVSVLLGGRGKNS